MPRGFDAELAALESLREATPADIEPALRKALAHRNNFIVAKAAKMAGEYELRGLTPDLAQAFPRFMQDPGKTDPQCWAKDAIAQTLAAFEYQEPEIFLAGMRHIQLEGSWGGQSDCAGPLRGICCLALVQCRGLSNVEVLTQLTPLFADSELPVRVNAARAVEQIGTDAASLMLRLRAELGSDEPELLGACYTGVLHLAGESGLPWAAKFLRADAPDETSSEAAFAIADTRSEAAFRLLLSTWKQARDADFRATLLTAIALTRQEAAYEFLLEKAAEGNRDARAALENSAAPQSVLERLG
jgi:hypothetical protein